MATARIVKRTILGVVIGFIILVGGLLLVAPAFTGSAPAPLQLPPLSPAPTSATPAPLDGTWISTDESLAGFRVAESFLTQSSTIVGRTGAVTGSVVIADNEIATGSFHVDLRQVTVGGKPNASFFQLLETSKYPEATVTLTQPIVFDLIPTTGAPLSTQATVALALHGITRAVTLTMMARSNGSALAASGAAPVLAADWGIQSPFAVHNDAVIEFLVVLRRE